MAVLLLVFTEKTRTKITEEVWVCKHFQLQGVYLI